MYIVVDIQALITTPVCNERICSNTVVYNLLRSTFDKTHWDSETGRTCAGPCEPRQVMDNEDACGQCAWCFLFSLDPGIFLGQISELRDRLVFWLAYCPTVLRPGLGWR